MGVSFTTVLLTGSFTAFLLIVFTIERRRGVRFGENVRAVFDRTFIRSEAALKERFPSFNRFFVQQLFFYILHLVFSFVLALIRKLESLMLYVIRAIRSQTARLRRRENAAQQEALRQDTHLTAIAEHKRSVELSQNEKAKRKNAALRGDEFRGH